MWFTIASWESAAGNFFTNPKNKKMSNEIIITDEAPEVEACKQYDSVKEACKAGYEDAKTKAEEAAPKLKGAVSGAVHDVAYGVSYGSTFIGAFAHAMLPESIREGLSKGAEAGRAAAETAKETFQEAKKEQEPTVNDSSIQPV